MYGIIEYDMKSVMFHLFKLRDQFNDNGQYIHTYIVYEQHCV
jgi:hypothetical protein